MILFLSFVLYIVSFPRTISPIREARAFSAAKRQRRRQSFSGWLCVDDDKCACERLRWRKCSREYFKREMRARYTFLRHWKILPLYTAVDAFLPDNTTTASELSGGDQLSHRIKDIPRFEKEEMWNSNTYTTLHTCNMKLKYIIHLMCGAA